MALGEGAFGMPFRILCASLVLGGMLIGGARFTEDECFFTKSELQMHFDLPFSVM